MKDIKKPKEIFLEITSSDSIPADAVVQLPKDVIDAWNDSLDYDFKMRRKFSYYDVVFKSKSVGRGYKGHMTKQQNRLKRKIEFHKLDQNKTVKELFKLYPPKYF